tara:strand:+ start:2586 stop:3410 length:825 start_codon:yes stop_codon:yes gene_type:complete
MQKDIYTKNMIIKMKTNLTFLLCLTLLFSCAYPGMHMQTSKNGNSQESVYIESLGIEVGIEEVEESLLNEQKNNVYLIGNGDQIAITVWGLPEIFPITNINPDANLRRVDSNGNIFFPYVGTIKAEGISQNQLRDSISSALSLYFTDPQVDVTIARFNSQKVYLLGEVTKPSKINITDIPLTLAEALGEVNGIRTDTGSGSEVFVIRKQGNSPRIFRANLSSPAGFLSAGSFYLADDDIIYVNASGTARWNRVISQFFPFSSFLNSVDNLIENN